MSAQQTGRYFDLTMTESVQSSWEGHRFVVKSEKGQISPLSWWDETQ